MSTISKDSPQIVANQMRLPSGKVIRSYDRHDYVAVVEDGVHYMVDGGMDYIRRSGPGEGCSVYAHDDFELVREALVWGTYGINGDQPLTQIKLSEMEDGHITAVMDECLIHPWRRELMEKELEFRKEIKND